ncbi:MAG: metallophosphoesterase family protein [Chloroflexota bacterium]
MKIATLYDIHGNLPALEAVLAEIEKENVDAIVVGGDAIAGPMPNEVLDRLQTIQTPVHFILGNGESEVLHYLAGEPIVALTPAGEEGAKVVGDQLTEANKAFVRGWAFSVKFKSPHFGDILFCHATPHNNTHVFTKNSDPAKIDAVFDGVMADLVVCGHTHMQYDMAPAGKRVVNSGSVGLPFGEPGAHWLLIDETVEFKNTEFDREAAAETIRQSGSPDAEMFISRAILSTPSESDVTAVFSTLEEKQITNR